MDSDRLEELKMSFSIVEGMSEKEKKEVVNAVVANMTPVKSYFPTQMSEAEHEAFKQAEREHVPNVACRIVNFRVQYYNTVTGEVVSEHV